jgi:hypothetical protein
LIAYWFHGILHPVVTVIAAVTEEVQSVLRSLCYGDSASPSTVREDQNRNHPSDRPT